MIRVEKLCHSVGEFALRNIDLSVRPGEYFVLLGPSGAGKTLLLECLCGLRRIDSGRIVVDHTDVTGKEPRYRRIGYLPQDYALFPHLSVRQNVGFGLGNPLAVNAGTAAARIDELMQLVGITHLADRFPAGLSGGETQRVALARALATEPKVLLLDEPVSALDEQMRDALCQQLKQLQADTGTTTVHVCHNLAEMLAVADRVGIIHQGQIVQVGKPNELLEHPRTRFVAEFLRAGNVLSGSAKCHGDVLHIHCTSEITFLAHRPEGFVPGPQVRIAIRPENVELLRHVQADCPPHTTVLPGTVQKVVDAGSAVHLHVACDSLVLEVFLSKREYRQHSVAEGQAVRLAVAADHVHVLDD